MNNLTAAMALTLILLLLPMNAFGQALLSEDFQDGNADGWAGNPGRGDIRVTEYQGNYSLRLTRDASAVSRVASGGAGSVSISIAFAAQGLEEDDACRLEVSADGQAWFEVGHIGDGQDDGVTLHTVSGSLDMPDTEFLFVGIRIDGNADNDICWADNLTIMKERPQTDLQQSIPQAVLSGEDSPVKPYSTAAFTMPAEAALPEQEMVGRLTFAGDKAQQFELLKDDFGYAPGSGTLDVLPPFSVDLVTVGKEVIPVQRGPQPGNHPDWEWIVEPGRVWQVQNGTTRVSLPFALQERNANCLHNGLMLFDLSATGQASHLVYQIASETCAYMQFNLWGSAPVTFESRDIPQTDDIRAAYVKEKAARLTVRPISDLPFTDELGSPQEVPPGSMSTYGFVDGNVHYTGGCPTRFGPYPYCDVLDIPSYSLAKSIVAGIASMRLEKLYPGAMDSLLTDYIPACGTGRWADVRLADLLNMTSGVYNSVTYDEDESSDIMRRFFLADSHEEKLAIACSAFQRKQAPGEVFVYRTADTYILGTALNAYLREETGNSAADYYRDLIVPIWQALGLSPVVMQTRRTYDDVGQPFTGWGLTLHRNDIVLITRFLLAGGVVNGEVLLDEEMLKAALQRDPSDRGLPAVIDSQRYKNGFWAWNAGPVIGCAGDTWIPVMSGFGGLTAALMPNDTVYYYVSDGGAYAWARAAAASNAYKPFCEKKL